jgi:hypothetical protein
MGKQSTITKSKASCPLLFIYLIEKGKKFVNKKSRMGTHPSKSTRQKRTQVNTTQRKTKANNQQNQVKTLCKDDLRLLNDNQLSKKT